MRIHNFFPIIFVQIIAFLLTELFHNYGGYAVPQHILCAILCTSSKK